VNERGSAGKVLLVVVLGIILAFAALYALVMSMPSDYDKPAQQREASSSYTVKYEVVGVSGSTKASVTYENAQGGTEQRDIKLPWSKTYTMERGSFVYISAQNDHEYGGVACRIYVDGVEWKKSESKDEYVIASCSGSVGR